MDKRKIILLFLASSTFSLMVFFIIYGLFIKDATTEDLIKPPQTAPVLPESQMLETTQTTTKPIDVNIPKPVEEEPKQPEATSTVEQTGKTAEKTLDKTKTTETTKTPEKETVKTTVTKPAEKTEKTTPKTTATSQTKAPLPRIEPDSKAPVPKTTTSKTTTVPLPPKPTTEPVVMHTVYVRGFTSEKAAQEAASELSKNPKTKAIVSHKNGQVVLQFGTFSDKTNADKLKQELKTQNINAQTD